MPFTCEFDRNRYIHAKSFSHCNTCNTSYTFTILLSVTIVSGISLTSSLQILDQPLHGSLECTLLGSLYRGVALRAGILSGLHDS